MDAQSLQSKLEASGELIVKVTEFDQPLELHLHDTEISDDVISLELADGELEFSTDEVVGAWKHYHSLADYGLE
ncbi:hypothetical protein OB919_16400 [Halobacteria archaeon AArc-curdl1]|uniref:Uncharacterized protein n=1 Tax=Natronosalvus hydrolyticus TaxID=2979988 RepID=A0AAP2ZB55_9EURY|nr:hypothetical protein [Halobacteria archaeon AArc-curdl1]